jgi:RNA polymerase sigma-70 factor (ECF subfamily)
MGEPVSAISNHLSRDFAELEPVLRAWAIRATGDPEAAKDAVQETLVAALAQPAQFDGRSKLRTWLIGILAHKVADHFRRRHTQAFEPIEEVDPPGLLETMTTSEVERVVSARRDLARVDRALATLPRRERLALLLVDVEGVDRDEACRTLDVSATHLRVLLHRGRNRLRVMVQRDL